MADEYLGPSKSAVKRELKHIKDLGLSLSKLSKGQLKTIPLSEDVLRPLFELQLIRSNVAKKRQTQYLAKVLSNQENLAEIELSYENILGQTHKVDANFHLAERWRDELIEDPKQKITEFMSQYNAIASQELRHLVLKAAKEKQNQTNHGAYKALFRFIKPIIESYNETEND